MNQFPDPQQFSSITGGVVTLGNLIQPTFIVDGQPVTLPDRGALLAYASAVERSCRRWADQPERPQPPLYDLALPLDGGPQAYIDTRGQVLPMRVSEFRPQRAGGEQPPQELIAAVLSAPRTILVGEPGSGKTTALERLAWLLALHTLQAAAPAGEAEPAALPIPAGLVIPLLVPLKEYRGEADLLPLIAGTLNRAGVFSINPTSTRLLLRAQDVRFVLLLDGLNELGRHDADGRIAIRRTLADYPALAVHATCRTADFDSDREATAEIAWLPGAEHWLVQPLVDTIRFWADEEGESDVRTYLRRSLGDARGKRLWDRIHADERLRTLALNPLLLWMLKEVGGGQAGDLPADRGALVRDFVRSTRLLGAVDDKRQRRHCERVLEEFGWRLQVAHTLECPADAFDQVLQKIDGVDGELARGHLVRCRLLLEEERDKRDYLHLLHQLVQEYAAASRLVRQPDAQAQLAAQAADEWWRETLILALWLDPSLQDPAWLQELMRTPFVDLRVRVAAATILGRPGADGVTQDPRFAVQARQVGRGAGAAETVRFIEPRLIPIPGGQALLGGEDEEASGDELPGCAVEVAGFELALWPVTNAEYHWFVAGGGYDDPSLWTPDGQSWLAGSLALDAETEQQYRQVHQALRSDVEGVIASLRAGGSLSDEDAVTYRRLAAIEEDEFVRLYAQAWVGEQRRQPAWWGDSRYNRPTQPVVGVNWYEAMAYAAWLSRVTGKEYRLPSEAQWEWAARRGERRYPWGPDWDPTACNWSGSRLNAPSPVGVFAHGKTPDGIEELAGNVYEWTSSLYRPYPYVGEDGREDPFAAGLRVMRGGSWYTSPKQVRCAYRGRGDPWGLERRPGISTCQNPLVRLLSSVCCFLSSVFSSL